MLLGKQKGKKRVEINKKEKNYNHAFSGLNYSKKGYIMQVNFNKTIKKFLAWFFLINITGISLVFALEYFFGFKNSIYEIVKQRDTFKIIEICTTYIFLNIMLYNIISFTKKDTNF